jgi:O-antigen/teichoic acid export membrane protein
VSQEKDWNVKQVEWRVSGKSSSVIAGCFAMAAFAVAVLSGLFIDNPASEVLTRALLCLIMSYPIGLIVGMVCQRVLSAHVAAHKQANPSPDSPGAGAASLAPAGASSAEEEPIVI